MKVEAPMWSAWTTGFSAVNWGASDGVAAACCAFHLSTSFLISSLRAENSATCCSTLLKSAMISVFTVARSASARSASSRRSMSAKRAFKPERVSSVIRCRPRDRLFQDDALARGEQLRNVEQHDHLFAFVVPPDQRAQVHVSYTHLRAHETRHDL